MSRILVNAGHRIGADKGGGNNGQSEAKTNVNEAIRLANNLRANGHIVVTTHDHPQAKFLNAVSLLAWANKQRFNYLISIHQNDSENENAEGSEVCWNGTDKEAEKIAISVQSELVKLGAKDRGVKPRPDLAILKIKKCHCILTEGAFMTTKDNHRIDTLTEQWAQADAVSIGFCKVVKK